MSSGTFIPGQQTAEAALRARAEESFTGRMEMTSATGDVALVWFGNGSICATTVPGSRPRLGVRLLSAGLVRPEDLDRALREQSQDADAGPVGDLLVRVGAVEREEVEHFVRIQLVDMISDLLGWDLIGTAVFAGDIPPKALDEPFGVDVVLREAMERREVWEAMVQRFGGPQGVPRPSMLAAPRANLLLGPYDWAVLTKVDGLHSLETLADHCGLSLYETAHVINGLADVGLVVLPPPPSRPAGKAKREPRRRSSVDAASLLRELSALNRAERPEG